MHLLWCRNSIKVTRSVFERLKGSKFAHAQLFCAWTRARAKLAGARVAAYACACSAFGRTLAYERSRTRVCRGQTEPTHTERERAHTRRRLAIWRASTQHGVCMRVYAPPLVRGVCVHPHTRWHACASLCVGTQTKGGKPVSSGAPERREQPFYSIPGGKRAARSSRRRRRRTTSTPSTTTATSYIAPRRDTANRAGDVLR